ncbi:MAG: DNA repair protein RadC, partial [Deltaproteobacteria bacterium]|nr:DNA repair protein RadC [Deltaproteobacteria bacterium]
GTLKGIQERRAGELAAIRGLGVAKACRVVAAAELGRRAMRQRDRTEVLQTAADVGKRCAYLSHEKDEVFLAIALNGRNRVIGEWEVARGWESGVNLTPRQVYTLLIKEGATRVVFVHNHPSGDPTPSQEDVRFTARLLEAAQSLGIRVLDHVIVAIDGFVSLRERGGNGLEFGRG